MHRHASNLFEVLRTHVLSSLIDEQVPSAALESLEGCWEELSARLPPPRPAGTWAEPLRRAAEVGLSAVLLVLAMPLLALIALAIYLEDPGPVLFGHERVGFRGRSFICWKFRSMRRTQTTDLEDDPSLWETYVRSDFKVSDGHDPRITRVGRFIRSTYLDELPQLWNVVRGSMSLVGPRPVVPLELAWYGPLAEEFLSVRPGVSGGWQLTDHLPYPERVFVELAYVRLRSFRLDMRLLALTILRLLTLRDEPPEFLLPEHCRRSGAPLAEGLLDAAAGRVASDR